MRQDQNSILDVIHDVVLKYVITRNSLITLERD